MQRKRVRNGVILASHSMLAATEKVKLDSVTSAAPEGPGGKLFGLPVATVRSSKKKNHYVYSFFPKIMKTNS